MPLLSSAGFFPSKSILNFQKKCFEDTISVSNVFSPNRAGPNCMQWLSADDRGHKLDVLLF